MSSVLHCGDVLEVCAGLEENSFDACFCDPPYGLEFMGKEWDKLGASFKTSKGSGEWAKQHGTTRKGFDGYSAMPSYSRPDANIKCPDCGNWRDGRDPAKRDKRKGYRCVCGGVIRQQRRQVGERMQLWHQQWAEAVYRVLKPGAFLLGFGGTRTHHRLMCALEDAGFELRDTLMFLYGSGFPKSLSVSKAIDKAAGAEREVVGRRTYADGTKGSWRKASSDKYAQDDWTQDGSDRPKVGTAPATDLAKRFDGYGTSLKPAHEPIVVAMKPLDGTFAQNAEKWGVAGLAIDACRVKGAKPDTTRGAGGQHGKYSPLGGQGRVTDDGQGRWPANLILSHDCRCKPVGVKKVKGSNFAGAETGRVNAVFGKDRRPRPASGYTSPDGTETVEAWECVEDCPVRLLDEQSGELAGGHFPGHRNQPKTKNTYGTFTLRDEAERSTNSGGASRFYYCAKSSRKEREQGLAGHVPCVKCGGLDTTTHHDNQGREGNCSRNAHPTVKPLSLCEYLARLILPPARETPRRLLVPFAGSGSEMLGALTAGWDEVVGIEQDKGYCEIAERRLAEANEQGTLF